MTTAGLVGWATVLLLAGVVCPVCGAPQHTTNLGLQLGGAAYENQNWQILDQAVCAPGCVTGSVGNLIPAATAPFPCAATTGGLYLDTDCAQVCRCNPGQARWCRSDTGACLSATDCCLPPTTTTTTALPTSTTTTTLPVAANWCSAMLACWMLDEPAGSPRVNAQGVTTRNLLETQAMVSNDPVLKQEGLASALMSSDTGYLRIQAATDNTLATLAPPFTYLLWLYPTAFNNIIINSSNPTINGVAVQYDVANQRVAYNNTITTPVNSVPTATWAHVAVTHTGTDCRMYLNGVQSVAGSCAFGVAPGTQDFSLSYIVGRFSGRLDEVAVANSVLPAPAICRICSCGMRGELCTCVGTAYGATGRNATACGSCALPSDCSASSPTTTTLATTTTTTTTTTSGGTTTTTLLIISDSFESYTAGATLPAPWTSSSNTQCSTAQAHGGTKSLAAGIGGNPSSATLPLGASLSKWTLDFWVWIGSTGSTSPTGQQIACQRAASATGIAINMPAPTGVAQVFTGSTSLFTYTLPTTNAWHHYVLTVVQAASGGTITLTIDGAAAGSFTGDTRDSSGFTTVDQVFVQGVTIGPSPPAEFYIDDLFVFKNG